MYKIKSKRVLSVYNDETKKTCQDNGNFSNRYCKRIFTNSLTTKLLAIYLILYANISENSKIFLRERIIYT